MSVSDLLVKEGDGELELVYYNWRYYNPLLIWLRRDCYISDNNENKYCMCHNNPIGSYDLLGMKTREQREADRRNAHARQATGRMLNREKARQNDINRLANQNTNVHTNNTLVPGVVNGLANFLDIYLFFETLWSTATVYDITNDIEKHCKDAKNENHGQNTSNGCCVARFVINMIYYNNSYVRFLARDGIQIYYYQRPCESVCFIDRDLALQEIIYVKIPMVSNTIYLN